MIRCEVIENFNLKDYDKIKIVERKGADIKGQLNKGDIFECDKEMADYLLGNNALNKVVVKVIEVEPKKAEIVINNINNQPIGELQPKVKEAIEYLENKKSTKKKKSSKK